MYQRLSLPNEITTGESRGTKLSSAQASVLFPSVAIRGGTSVTYVFNDVNINNFLRKSTLYRKHKSMLGVRHYTIEFSFFFLS